MRLNWKMLVSDLRLISELPELLSISALTRASATAASTSVPVLRIRMALTEAEIRAWWESRSGIEAEPRSVEHQWESASAMQTQLCSLASGPNTLHFQLWETVAYIWIRRSEVCLSQVWSTLSWWQLRADFSWGVNPTKTEQWVKKVPKKSYKRRGGECRNSNHERSLQKNPIKNKTSIFSRL